MSTENEYIPINELYFGRQEIRTTYSILITNTNSLPLSILLPASILEYYPKHYEWIEKCQSIERPGLIAIDEKGKIIGCIIFKESQEKKSIKIGYFYVLPLYRIKSCGTTLLMALESYATQNKYEYVYTNIKRNNLVMRRFIVKNSFHSAEVTEHDEIVFTKTMSLPYRRGE